MIEQERYRNYHDHVMGQLRDIRRDVDKEFERFEAEMAPNDSEIEAADRTNDLNQRLYVRKLIIERIRKAADFAHEFTTITNEGHARMERYRNYQHHIEKQLLAIEADIAMQFDRIEDGMKPNDAQIEAADRTHNLIKRLGTRYEVIHRSAAAADFAHRYAEITQKGYDRIEKYCNYHDHVMGQLQDIRRDIDKQFERFEAEMAPNDSEIEAADRTNDLNQRLHVRKLVIERSRKAADFAHEFTTITHEGHDRMERYRNYQHHIEKQLFAIEEDIAEKQRQERVARGHQIDKEGGNGNGDKQEQSEAEELKECEIEKNGIREKRKLASDREGGDFLEVIVDGEQLVERLGNIDRMFNGQMAPDMDTFDNIVGAFIGEKTFGEVGAERQDGQEPLNGDVEFDSSIAEDYLITSYQYRDADKDVAMDIGRITKFGFNGLDYFGSGDGSMDLKGININPRTRKVTFALNNNREKVLIKSDLGSMKNYVGQKVIKETVHLQITPEHLSNIDMDKLPIWGLEEQSADTIREITPTIANFIPLLGTSKAITELIFDYDTIAGQDVNRIVAASGLLLSMVPGEKAACKVVRKFVAKRHAIATKGIKYVEQGIEGLVKAPQAFLEAGYQGASRYFVKLGDQTVHVSEIIKQLESNVQEQLKHMKIPDKPLVPNGGLIYHEWVGGDVIKEHVGKSTDELIERFSQAKPSPIVDHFSTFNNLKEAEYFVAETIKANSHEIQVWLKDAQRSQEFELSFEKEVGKLLERGEKLTRSVFRSRVVLVPSKECPEGYRILTAYPIER